MVETPCPANGIDCLIKTCRLDTPDFFSSDCSRMVCRAGASEKELRLIAA